MPKHSPKTPARILGRKGLPTKTPKGLPTKTPARTWAGLGPSRVEDCEGDVQTAWLIHFGQTAMVDSLDWNITGVKRQFTDREGWAPLDGSCGIELIRCDSLEFDRDEFDVKEKEVSNG